MISVNSRDDEQTRAFGAALARSLPSAPARAVRVFLQGDLGAGKTTLVRGFLQALGERRTVRSPTYSLLETYECSPWRIAHLDLYRLQSPQDLLTLGLADLDESRTVWLIEWPERGEGVLPAPDLVVSLSGTPNGHPIRIDSRSEVGALWLEGIRMEPEFSSAVR